MSELQLLVLPVSGGFFVNQCAAVERLCETGYKPQACFASSGGNVTSYISSAADWDHNRIKRVAEDLNSKIFCSPWFPVSFISSICGYFKGEMFNYGTGTEKFFREYFDSQTVKKTEIWTGTYNTDIDKICLFCNRGPEDSIFCKIDFDQSLMQIMAPVYADGDLALISQASLASASVPTVVPPQIIDKHNYVDGGIFSASPLGTMQSSLMKKVRKNKSNLHITYLNCMDLDEVEEQQPINIIQNSKIALKKAIRCQIVNDRMVAYNCIAHFGETEYQEFPINEIYEVQKIRNQYSASLLEIYPIKSVEVDITNFTGDDVIKGIEDSYHHLRCRFWYVKN